MRLPEDPMRFEPMPEEGEAPPAFSFEWFTPRRLWFLAAVAAGWFLIGLFMWARENHFADELCSIGASCDPEHALTLALFLVPGVVVFVLATLLLMVRGRAERRLRARSRL
jgi:hypothetical protein